MYTFFFVLLQPYFRVVSHSLHTNFFFLSLSDSYKIVREKYSFIFVRLLPQNNFINANTKRNKL